MKIAILGGGFTGLTAALRLSQKGHEVTVFEKEDIPGGLASGFKGEKWNWSLEKAYHHFFTNDKFALDLAKEIGQEITIKHPLTAIYYNPNSNRHSGEPRSIGVTPESDSRQTRLTKTNGFWTSQNDDIFPIDSPLNLLRFPYLSFIQKMRTGLVILYLKFTNNFLSLEKYTAYSWLTKYMGKKPFEILFKPLFVGKFGKYADKISMSWFWARIKKRTPSLAYPVGGFQSYLDKLVIAVTKSKGKVLFNTPATSINQLSNYQFSINNYQFNAVISTLPSPIFLKLTQNLNVPENFQNKLKQINHLSALNLVLELKEPFFQNGEIAGSLSNFVRLPFFSDDATGKSNSVNSEKKRKPNQNFDKRPQQFERQNEPYWLNINDTTFPFLALVEHTNFMDKKNYNNHHLLYIGNYLPKDHEYFKKSKEELLNIFDPYLKKFNKNYQLIIINSYLFTAPFAQPIVETNYSKLLPPLETGIKNLYAGNLDNVYPWDRGTNYAIELGEKLAEKVR